MASSCVPWDYVTCSNMCRRKVGILAPRNITKLYQNGSGVVVVVVVISWTFKTGNMKSSNHSFYKQTMAMAIEVLPLIFLDDIKLTTDNLAMNLRSKYNTKVVVHVVLFSFTHYRNVLDSKELLYSKCATWAIMSSYYTIVRGNYLIIFIFVVMQIRCHILTTY